MRSVWSGGVESPPHSPLQRIERAGKNDQCEDHCRDDRDVLEVPTEEEESNIGEQKHHRVMEEIDDKCSIGNSAEALFPGFAARGRKKLDNQEAEKEKDGTNDCRRISEHSGSFRLQAKQSEWVGQM